MDFAGSGAPDPERVRDPAEFVAAMQVLKDRSGLTYRELTSRAEAVGDVLPRSTVANMLGRTTLPREELVAAFVRACGVGPGGMDAWLRVRKELARGERPEHPDTGAEEAAPRPEPQSTDPRPEPEPS
ncbi:helix-turn-helix domain-containing protein, partial [Streptomyces pristinaespiralis]